MKVITTHGGMEFIDEGAPEDVHAGSDEESQQEVEGAGENQTEKETGTPMVPDAKTMGKPPGGGAMSGTEPASEEPVKKASAVEPPAQPTIQDEDSSDDDSVYGMVVEPGALCEPCLQKVQTENAVQFVLENTEVTEVVPVGGLVHFTEGDGGGTVHIGNVLRRQVLYDVKVGDATFWQISPEAFGMVPVVTSPSGGEVAMGKSVNCAGKATARSRVLEKRTAGEQGGRKDGGNAKKPRKSDMQRAEEKGEERSKKYIGKAIQMGFSDRKEKYASVVQRYDAKTMKYYSFFDGYDGEPRKEYGYSHEMMLKSLIKK